ncbi:MAG TPA: rhodanese-like domain-containing protein [Thermoanaerobaculia bacterium]|nr:rhodanese-like domain-containing protein [Thermoanaerobaculia bacterium]
MNRKPMMLMAATLFAAGLLHAQYKPQPQQSQPQPAPMPQLIPSTPAATEPDDGARRISRPDAIKLVKEGKAILIDVRAKDQYETEHIKGAINIPWDEIAKRASQLPKKKLLITYCA